MDDSADFFTSSFCGKDACVEVAFVESGVMVRDGKDRAAPALRFGDAAWRGFVGGLRGHPSD